MLATDDDAKTIVFDASHTRPNDVDRDQSRSEAATINLPAGYLPDSVELQPSSPATANPPRSQLGLVIHIVLSIPAADRSDLASRNTKVIP